MLVSRNRGVLTGRGGIWRFGQGSLLYAAQTHSFATCPPQQRHGGQGCVSAACYEKARRLNEFGKSLYVTRKSLEMSLPFLAGGFKARRFRCACDVLPRSNPSDSV